MSQNPDSTLVLNQDMNTYSFLLSKFFRCNYGPDFTHQCLKRKLEKYSGGVGRSFFCFLPQTLDSLYFDSVPHCFNFNRVVVVLES